MATRKLTAVEKQGAEAMARARLAGGELPSKVVVAIRAWLVGRDWNPNSARTRAGQIVTEMVEILSSPPKKLAFTPTLYEAWRLPGQDAWQEGEISASEAKTLGAVIKVKGASREFHVEYDGRELPWSLLENQPVGTPGAVDNFVPLDAFSTMTEARAVARMLARGGER